MDWNSRHWGWALALELAPAALFNFAVAFAVASLVGGSAHAAFAAEAAVAAGLAAFLIAWAALRRFGSGEPGFAMARFESAPVRSYSHDADQDELLLTQVFAPAGSAGGGDEDELLLEDVFETIGPQSRVVRLFQPNRVPTAGELQARIDRHLRSGSPRPAPPDASEALHEALAALRQSLR